MTFGGNLRLAVIKGTSVYYYHKDHLGSTGAITDSAGNKVEGVEYLPFGTMREHTGTDTSAYKFTDQELDDETGLYNYDARLYDPVIGRFLSPDPYMSANLAAILLYNIKINYESFNSFFYNPQNLNRYSYCDNNPLIYTDPTGLKDGGEVGGPGGGWAYGKVYPPSSPPTEPVLPANVPIQFANKNLWDRFKDWVTQSSPTATTAWGDVCDPKIDSPVPNPPCIPQDIINSELWSAQNRIQGDSNSRENAFGGDRDFAGEGEAGYGHGDIE